MQKNKPGFLQSLATSFYSAFGKKQFSMVLPWDKFQWADTYETYASEGYAKNSVGFFAIETIAEKCGEIPLKLWKIENGEKVQVESHPILELLQRPNFNQFTYSKFVEAWVSYLKLAGNSYMWTTPQGGVRRGIPAQVLLAQPNTVQARFDRFDAPIEYEISIGNSQKIVIPFETGVFNPINHTKTFNPQSQRMGLSAFSALRYSVQLLNETNLFAVNFVKNRCSPPGLLSTDGMLQPDQVKQLEKVLEEKYTGPQNAGTPMVLWGGLKWQSMTNTGREQISMMDGRAINDRDIARTLGVPPILLHIPGDTKFNNLDEAKRELVLNTCRPLMMSFAQSLNNWLLDSATDQALFLEPDIDDLPEIRQWRMESWKKVDDLKSISINEKRTLMGFETKEGEVYDDVFVAGNIVLASDFGTLMEDIDNSDSELLDQDEDDEKAITYLQCKTIGVNTPRQRALYRKQYTRIFSQLERRLTNKLKRFFNAQSRKVNRKRREFQTLDGTETAVETILLEDSKKLFNILSQHYKSSFNTFDKFLNDGLKAKLAVPKVKQSAAFDFATNEFIRNNAAKHVKILNNTTKKRIVAEIREIIELANLADEAPSLLELSEVISGTYKDFSLKRAAVIARTETTTAVMEGSVSSVREMALSNPKKTWLSDLRGEGISRPNHFNQMNEITIGLEELFEVPRLDGGFDFMKGPGDQNAPVGQIANCVCILAFSADDLNEVE